MDIRKLLVMTGKKPIVPVAFDYATKTNHQNTTSITYTHVVGSGNNRILFVEVTTQYIASPYPIDHAVTCNGTPMTLLDSNNHASGFYHVLVFYLVNPTTGDNTIVASWTNAAMAVVGSKSLANVNQATPVGLVAKATGTSTTPSTTVASEIGNIVADVVFRPSSGAEITYAAGEGQTIRYQHSVLYQPSSAGSTKPGAISTTMDWILGASAAWRAMSWDIKHA